MSVSNPSSHSHDLYLSLFFLFLLINISTSLLASASAAASAVNRATPPPSASDQTVVAVEADETQQFIKASCSTTSYPDLCYTSLSSYASKIKTASPKEVAIGALIVTLGATKASSAKMDRVSKSRMNPRDASAMEDCLELLDDSAGLLHSSIHEMEHPDGKSFELVMNDVQTWVSAALTDDSTCMDGFDEIHGDEDGGDSPIRELVRDEITKVSHLTSNALALISNCAAASPPPHA